MDGDLDVLIVDDHEAMRVMLARVMASAGVKRVREASRGELGLQMQAEAPAHLILVDSGMPGMDGVSFINAVRADERYGAPCIVMITGHDHVQLREAAHAAGANAVMVKPVSPRALIAKVQDLMR
jgi:two-component system chemotaxis response regulator CheY